MSKQILEKALTHEVTHEFSGKSHFFKVRSITGEEYEVSIKASCNCRFSSVQGIPNGKVCSHILAVLRKISGAGQIGGN